MNHNKTPTIVLPGYFTSFWPYAMKFDRLIEMGHEIIMPHGSLVSLSNIHAQALRLSKKVDEILERYEVSRCNIIGSSMGGVVALYYIQELGGAEKVNIFIAIGAPFKGTWKTLLGIFLHIHLISPPLWEMLPISSTLRCIVKKPKPRGVKIYALIAKDDKMVPPASCFYPHAEENFKLDGGHSHLCQGYSKELPPLIDRILKGKV